MVRVCPSCGQQNRINAANLAGRVRCGRCKADIAPVNEPIDADATTFEQVQAA